MNTKITALVATLALIVCCSPLSGQNPVVVGAEIHKIDLSSSAQIQIGLYTRYAPKDSVFIDWGDGVTNLYYDFSPHYWPGIGIYLSLFYAYHYYDVPGYYTIKLVERDIADSVLNIENSGEKAMIIKDTILIPSPEQTFIVENLYSMLAAGASGALLSSFFSPGDWSDEDGIQIFDQSCACVNPHVGYVEYSVEPFPAEGAEPLPATNSVYIEDLGRGNSLFIWDRPVAPGRYGFGVRVRQFMRDLENPTDTTLLATTLRAVIIDLDSTMTLTSTGMPGFDGIISLHPNPAADLLHLQIGGFHAPVQVRIFDALGREVYETQADAASQVETLRIPVAAWPAGVYSVQIESGGKVLTRQVAVQR